MKSNWETSKERSNYHFDTTVKDLPSYCVQHLGAVVPNWLDDLPAIVESAKPATWATRGYKGEGLANPPADLAAEEYDLTSNGMNKDLPITHLNWNLPDSLQELSDGFGLAGCMNRIHVQMPGEVWNLHIDKLQKWCPEDPEKVMRIFIQLTDWQPGQFWEFGNYHWNQWRAGDITTFDWANMPHCTANAGYHPRVTFQITGVKTEKTQQMLDWLAYRLN